MTHLRELEDAFGDYLAGNLVDTTSLHKDDVAFGDLLYYLEIIHPRWKGVKVSDLVPNKHVCFKNLSQALSNWKRNPKKLAELKQSREEVDDRSERSEAAAELNPDIPEHISQILEEERQAVKDGPVDPNLITEAKEGQKE